MSMIQMPIEKPPTEKEPTNESAQELIYLTSTYMPSAEKEQVQQALRMARETCEGKRGLRLLPPLEHALAIAKILAQLHIDAIGVSAGLIFEAVDAAPLALERVEGEFAQVGGRVAVTLLP